MEEITYPIKYAIMPVTNYIENDGLVFGYIVTKVYIVSESIRYLPNTIKKSYNVVYPVKGLKTSLIMKDLRKPEFDRSGVCINSEHNNNIFDTYSDAKNVCTEMNNALFRNNITNYTELTNRMQEFELKVLEKTSIIPNPEDINGKTR